MNFILPQAWIRLVTCTQAFQSVTGITWSKMLADARGEMLQLKSSSFSVTHLKPKIQELKSELNPCVPYVSTTVILSTCSCIPLLP